MRSVTNNIELDYSLTGSGRASPRDFDDLARASAEDVVDLVALGLDLLLPPFHGLVYSF